MPAKAGLPAGEIGIDGARSAPQRGGMNAFLGFHVALSLVGIGTGFVAVFGLVRSKLCAGWTAVFLATTLATSLTGFFFPFHGFTPAIGLGLISTLVLAVTCYALYGRKLAGAWRGIYAVGAVLAQYLNFFVLIAQSFMKIPALHALAPTGKEPPFALAQGVALLFFIGLGWLATKRFHPGAAPA